MTRRFAYCPHCGFQTQQAMKPDDRSVAVWECQLDPKHRIDVGPRVRAALRERQ